jgi:hypothetical protein
MGADLLGSVAALLITIMILSYLIGDNPAFRVAVNLFVGVAAGYVAAVAWWQVLLPRLFVPLLSGSDVSRATLAVPMLLSGLLLMKAWPPLSRLGSPSLGLLVGVAAAVAVGGAIQGTLVPQLTATLDGMDLRRSAAPAELVSGAFIMLGLIATLVYFHFSAGPRKDGSVGRPPLVELIARFGGVFIAITLGMLFAGVYSAALVALVERLHFIWSFLGLG